MASSFTQVPDKEYGFDNIYKHSDDDNKKLTAEYLSRKNIKSRFFGGLLMTTHIHIQVNMHVVIVTFLYGNIDIPDIRDCPGLPATLPKPV